ncbi:MAG: DUF523 domain-containing protein [Acidaminococcaceae bacterium]
MPKEPILVSACFLGIKCRYNGDVNINSEIAALSEKYNLIPVCPEILGGLFTPRPPAERLEKLVVNKEGGDVTAFFKLGAERTAAIAVENGCRQAVLKAQSPSCGCGVIYDGTFSGNKIAGNGVTAEKLLAMNINIVTETNLQALK